MLVGAEMDSSSTYRPSPDGGDAYVTCTISNSHTHRTVTHYIPVNMAGRCMQTPGSVTLGELRVETVGSNKCFEIHVHELSTGGEIPSGQLRFFVETKAGKSGKYTVQNPYTKESITIRYAFTDTRSKEQRKRDSADHAERFCVSE